MFTEAKNVLAVATALFLASHMAQITEGQNGIQNKEEISGVLCGTPGIFCWCWVGYRDKIYKAFDYKDLSDVVNYYVNDTNGEDSCKSTCSRKCDRLFKDKGGICEKIEDDYNSTYQQFPIGCFSQIGEKPDYAIKQWTLSKTPEDLCCKATKKGCEMEYGPEYVYDREHNMCLKELYQDGCLPQVPLNDKKPPVCCLTDSSTGQSKTYGCQPAHNCGFVDTC